MGGAGEGVQNTKQICALCRFKFRSIGVARIFLPWGALFFLEQVDDLFLVVALKTQAKTPKLTTPTLRIYPAQQNNS